MNTNENENKQMNTKTIPIEQALEMQFAKVGKMGMQIDIMTQQMIALENENKQLKEQLEKKKTK
jgi:regulator of replication initiation timing